MAVAGWCGQCAAFVWVKPDGSCANGHATGDVSNTYETDPASQAPAAAPASANAGSATADEPDAGANADRLPPADTVRLKTADLVAAVARSGIAPGPLAPSFGVQASPDAAARLAAISGQSAEILEGAVAALANPARAALLQFSVVDETVSRLVLAWNPTMEQVAVVARDGIDVSVSVRSPDVVYALLAGTVGLDGFIEPVGARVELSPTQAISWVAAADTLRRSRLQSMLAHVTPTDRCTVADVAATVAAAEDDDFRWALNMLGRVMPAWSLALPDAASMAAALDGLVAAGVLDCIPAGDGMAALYGLADVGVAAFDAWSHEVSRLAVTVHGFADGGGTTAETVLMVRDARRLWVVTIGSARAGLACIGVGAAERVLRAVAGSAIPEPAASANPAAAG